MKNYLKKTSAAIAVTELGLQYALLFTTNLQERTWAEYENMIDISKRDIFHLEQFEEFLKYFTNKLGVFYPAIKFTSECMEYDTPIIFL